MIRNKSINDFSIFHELVIFKFHDFSEQHQRLEVSRFCGNILTLHKHFNNESVLKDIRKSMQLAVKMLSMESIGQKLCCIRASISRFLHRTNALEPKQALKIGHERPRLALTWVPQCCMMRCSSSCTSSMHLSPGSSSRLIWRLTSNSNDTSGTNSAGLGPLNKCNPHEINLTKSNDFIKIHSLIADI